MYQPSPILQEAEKNTSHFARLVLLVIGCIVFLFLLYRVYEVLATYIRYIACVSSNTQRFFIYPNPTITWLKKNVVYAPLFRRRHNSLIKLSSAVSFGTLPTRFEFFLVSGILVMNIVLCAISIPSHAKATEDDILSIVISRTGVMAVVNCVPLVVIAGRNNPLIRLLDISFATWNLLHRWFGRVVVMESLAHVITYCVQAVRKSGVKALSAEFSQKTFFTSGLVAACCSVAIVILGTSHIRHAFYEVFLHTHIILASLMFGFLYVHIKKHSCVKYLQATVILWGLERLVRLCILVYRNICLHKISKLDVELLPGEAMRVTVRMARPWTFRPGQHAYIYVPAIGLWTSHPFTLAWGPRARILPRMRDAEKGILEVIDQPPDNDSSMSMVIRRRAGFTDDLWKETEKAQGTLQCRALLEGPYGAEHSLDSYGTVLLFAAGIGVTHPLPYIRHLVQGFLDNTVVARRITLVWIVQSQEHLNWIHPWINEILSLHGGKRVLKIMIFVSRPENARTLISNNETVSKYPGKPNIATILDWEISTQAGAMGVSVCGTGTLADDVRQACRSRQHVSEIDFVEEAFSW